MLYTITYSRAGALRALAGGQAPERYATDPKTQMDIPTGRYNAAVLPGTFKVYRPARRIQTGEVMVDGTQDEVNKLVLAMQLATENGEPITEAPLRAPGAPFWKTDAASLRIEGGSATLDDDDPKDALLLMFMRADPRIQVFGEKFNPALSGLTQYVIKKFGDEEKVKSAEIDLELEAVAVLMDLSFERQKQILSAMGVAMRSPEPNTVRDHLYLRITKEKDKPANGMKNGELNLAMFMRLAKEKTDVLNLRDAFTVAYKSKKIIRKNKQNEYVYGEFILGTSVEAAIIKLQTEEAAEILAELIRDVNA